MYSMAAPHAKGKSAEDNIFAANNRAIALAEKIGAKDALHFAQALVKGTPHAGKIALTVASDTVRELV